MTKQIQQKLGRAANAIEMISIARPDLAKSCAMQLCRITNGLLSFRGNSETHKKAANQLNVLMADLVDRCGLQEMSK